ncbi:SPFH domain-containing protein [Paenibacillus tuaregi]|uniref:SPFH domain-containing protein n=1 Tax=Paenibacillus tuaregi TaxID=1816681 RepID=UPI00083831C4|nr:SPFH domain-containing protein [Paenibacillus tuaregi]
MQEKQAFRIGGLLSAVILLVVAAAGVLLVMNGQKVGAVAFVISGLLASSFVIVGPNESKVITFLGKYVGSINEAGFYFTVPFSARKTVSLKVINFNSEKLKVNDVSGNPIEIAAVIVYKVTDSAKAAFGVDSYDRFVQIQSETGLRHIASKYPYDNHDVEGVQSLRANADEVANELRIDLQDRLSIAGVEVIEARLMHLAYAPEIAQAMLQRQQASAILAARKIIVEGAVEMVRSTMASIEQSGVAELDDEKKAQMINNLMVAMVSERSAQPIINTGTIY